jgi:hypothetical protein
MAVKVSSDNVSGEIQIGLKGTQPGTGERELNEAASTQANQAWVNDGINNAYKTLPAKQGAEDNINFLGSSYSGADVKVIAHLYDTVQWRDKEIADLDAELRLMDSVRNGCLALSGGLGLGRFADPGANDALTYTERRRIFIQATSLSESDEAEALGILLRSVFRSGNFSFLGIARMRRDNDNLLESTKARIAAINTNLENLRAIKEESSATVALGTLQTLSVQSHREKFAVRALGMTYAKNYTRGPRTIAGSMIFTVFNEHPLLKLIRAMGISKRYGEKDADLSSLLPDQLPPIDLTIAFANEYGSLSDFRLYGVEFVNDAVVYSIEDLLSEQSINFVCRDADVMTSRGKVRLSRLQGGMSSEVGETRDIAASELLFSNNDYEAYLDKLSIRRRLKNR